jgi:F-type H+-transporting ATPase subunit b
MLDLNLSTILLQMANFFILAFILYRFLFKPLQNVLKKREKEITREMDEAEKAKKEAEEMRQSYEEKTHNIDAEIAARKNEARIVIEQTRQQMLQEVQGQVEEIKAQTEETLAQIQKDALQQHKQRLGNLAAEFSRGILSDVMRPEIQKLYREEFLNRIRDVDLSEFVEDIPAHDSVFIRVILASKAPAGFEEQLSEVINISVPREIQLSYEIDPGLIAGGILRFENELIDGSLDGQIKQFQKRYQEIA